MINTAAEYEPRAAISAKADNLVDCALNEVFLVGGALQLAGDEFAAALADARGVDLGVFNAALRDQRCEPPVFDRLADAVGIDQFVKESVVALIEASTIEPIRRRGEAGAPHSGVDLTQPVDDLVIHPGAGLRDPLCLIDDQQTAPTHIARIAED